MKTALQFALALAAAQHAHAARDFAPPFKFHPRGSSLSNSKLSIHSGGGDSSFQVLEQAQPRVVKLLDTFGDTATKMKAAVPGIQIVGRIYLPEQPQTGDPAAAALAWMQQNNETIMSSPDVDYWEGYNEPGTASIDDMSWLATFDSERVRLLAEVGRKASVGNFGTGTPDVTQTDLMNAFNPAIDAALKNGGILGLHEYSSPTMMGCFDNATQTGWMTGRYRKWYQQLLLPANRKIPLVISENGIDNSPCDNSPNYGGWGKYCDWWQQNLGANDCGKEYIRQLAWYDSLLRADDYVIGATIFQLDCSGWGDYDLNQNNGVQDLIDYMNSV
eukprot:INCI14178.1.p1 GENE.INCI14178.1~~INCI14178.1.p1  ORF type:complete len:331 (+),score=73.83 INCI14178.1:165-1157(+)